VEKGNEAVNEMKQLEAMCAAVPPPEEDSLARARARVLTAASGTAAGRTARNPVPLRKRGAGWRARLRLSTTPRLALAGGIAVTTAAGIAIGLAGPAAPGPGTGIQLDAALVLHRAAAAALASPAPGPGQYLYIDVRGTGSRGTHRYRQQMWLPAGDGLMGTVEQTPCNFFGVAPRCTMLDDQIRGDADEPTYAWVKALSSDPGALLAYLEANSLCQYSALHVDTAHQAFSEVYNILSAVYVLPPTAGAALFNAAAGIPGVTVLHDVTDAAGGRGIAVAMTGRATDAAPAVDPRLGPLLRYELIFDALSYRFIGLQEVTADGTVHSAQAVISASVADSAPRTSSHILWGGVTPCIA
jgi:hypothetical protein